MTIWHAGYQDDRKRHSLIDKVWSLENLEKSWKAVRKNKGAGGIDKVSITMFETDANTHLLTIRRELRENRYRPMPVKRVYIPKSNGKSRPLGIPSVKDRIVQQALRQVLEPIFEPDFADESYGYRPNRSALDAIVKARENIQVNGNQAVADLDIKGFFDHMDHEILLNLVNEKVSDGRVLRLIRQFLKAGVMEDGKHHETEIGTPQGGVISPLLANIYLNHLDRRLKYRKVAFVRYADDVVIFHRYTSRLRDHYNVVKKILVEDLNLELNEEKSSVKRVTHTTCLEYLGYNIFLKKREPKYSSIERFKDNVRFLTRRQQGKSVEEVIKRLNPTIRGWGNYQKETNVKILFWKLDTWIQRRIRSYLKKRWWKTDIKRIPTEELLKLGLVTLESVLDRPRSLKWREFCGT